MLQWLREEDTFPWNGQIVCAAAAAGGHMEVLQWARENGCLWNMSTCEQAAQFGHLEVLRWARENGCQWNEGTCRAAADGGHLAAGAFTRPLLSLT